MAVHKQDGMMVETPIETQGTAGPYPRLSRTLADVLHGDHVLTGMEHRSRVEYLFGLQVLMEATLCIGWEEHTNDWDWAVTVEMEDGTMLGASFDEPYINCDSFKLDIQLDDGGQIPYVEGDYGQTRITELALLDVMGLEDDGNAGVTQLAEIDKIKVVHIEEM